MSLETFVKKYSDLKSAHEIVEKLKKDPYDTTLQQTAIDLIRDRTGIDLREIEQTRGGEELDVTKIRQALNNFYVTASERTHDYVNENLEEMLRGVNKQDLDETLVTVRPVSEGYDETRKVHETYKESYLLNMLKSGNEEQTKVAFTILHEKREDIIEQQLRDRNEELDKDDKMTEEEITIWKKTFASLGYLPINYVLENYEEKTEQQRDKLVARSDFRKYLAESIREIPKGQRMPVYDSLLKAA